MLEEEGNPPAVVDERPLLLLCSIVAKKDDYEMICVAPNENKLKRRNRYVIQVVDMCREPGCITALGVMIGHGSSVVLVDIERDSEGPACILAIWRDYSTSPIFIIDFSTSRGGTYLRCCIIRVWH